MPQSTQLPETIPELEDIPGYPAETFPPLRDRPAFETPEGLTDRRDLEVKLNKPELSASAVEKVIATTSHDPVVKSLLGESFTSIGAHRVHGKEGATTTLVLFYSYSNQWAVEALVTKGKVFAEVLRYQPCITDKELNRSVEIARGALSVSVDGLESGAIVIERIEPDDPYAGRRLVDVRFFAADERLARYFAVIDLATDKVLEAGSVADHHG